MMDIVLVIRVFDVLTWYCWNNERRESGLLLQDSYYYGDDDSSLWIPVNRTDGFALFNWSLHIILIWGFRSGTHSILRTMHFWTAKCLLNIVVDAFTARPDQTLSRYYDTTEPYDRHHHHPNIICIIETKQILFVVNKGNARTRWLKLKPKHLFCSSESDAEPISLAAHRRSRCGHIVKTLVLLNGIKC